MSTFAITGQREVIPAVNYLLSNQGQGTGNANITIPGNVLVANTDGAITQYGNTAVLFYKNQWINLRYSNNATGTSGFSTSSNNYSYFGVYNSATSTPSANPAAYQWTEVSPPFNSATSRTLYYSAVGGRQIAFAAASSPPNSGYLVTVANVAIDLNVVTTATGTAGSRGPVVMAAVVTTADPNTAISSTLTTWFSASRENTTAPIGTGLTPVTGDTASFTYAAGAGQPQAAYEYNGSIWVPVSGQVISGNVIVRGTIAGNAMIANTITATQIATDTITANNIAGNTITSAKIATGTITADNIAGNTITGNNIAAGTITTNNFTANTIQGNIIAAGTITAEQLAANAITANTVVSSGAVLGSNASLGFWLDGTTGNARFGNNLSIGTSVTIGTVISGGSLTSNSVGATQIINGSITTDKFTANTINGNVISAGTITADQLAANVLTANTVVSTGATLGNISSPGFWLQGNTGNARFGNSVSIGNLLTVGSNATIGGNLTVSNNANIGANLIIGTNANIGSNLTVSNNANIGANLIIGTNTTIGSNLTVGANANIGGNLFVSGLINGGNLNANTVATTTVVPLAISSGAGNTTTASQVISNAQPNTLYTSSLTLDFTTTEANQPLFVFAQAQMGVQFTTITVAPDVTATFYLRRTNISTGAIVSLYDQIFDVYNVTTADGRIATYNPVWSGISDTVPTPGNYRYSILAQFVRNGTVSGIITLYFLGRTLMVQTLKR